MLGIDFGGTKIALATATLEGRVMESDRLETDARAGAVQAVDRAAARAEELLEATARNGGGRCVAVSAVSPGVLYQDRALVVRAEETRCARRCCGEGGPRRRSVLTGHS